MSCVFLTASGSNVTPNVSTLSISDEFREMIRENLRYNEVSLLPHRNHTPAHH